MNPKHYPPKRQSAPPVRPGMTALGMSASRLGDLTEAAIVEQLGWTPLVGALAGKARQGAFDLQAPDGTWIELKAVTVFAAEYKVKPTAQDVREKLAHAEKHDAPCATVIAVVAGNGKARLYRREGLGCFRLGAEGRDWDYVGKVKVF